jgi:hypothetical protein
MLAYKIIIIIIIIIISLLKSKVFFLYALKAHTWSRGTLHSDLISTLEGREWSASGPGRPTSRKEPRYPFNRGPGEPESRSGRFGRPDDYPDQFNLVFVY